jgi:hypothetical protein
MLLVKGQFTVARLAAPPGAERIVAVTLVAQPVHRPCAMTKTYSRSTKLGDKILLVQKNVLEQIGGSFPV